VRELQRDGAARLERGLEATGEVVDVRHVGVDVVADDQVCLLALGGELICQRLAEEFPQHGNAEFFGGGGGAGGGLDTETRDAGSHDVP
jgi:hypothetical protein